MRRWKDIAVLFVQFMKFGCFTFGGGWSIVAQMQQLYVEQRHTITNEELLDPDQRGAQPPRHHDRQRGHAVRLPRRRAGGRRGLCAGDGVAPHGGAGSSHLLLYRGADNLWVMAAMTGVRASIVPIMAAAALNLVKGPSAFRPVRRWRRWPSSCICFST